MTCSRDDSVVCGRISISSVSVVGSARGNTRRTTTTATAASTANAASTPAATLGDGLGCVVAAEAGSVVVGGLVVVGRGVGVVVWSGRGVEVLRGGGALQAGSPLVWYCSLCFTVMVPQ